jgi:hypothetical protein
LLLQTIAHNLIIHVKILFSILFFKNSFSENGKCDFAHQLNCCNQRIQVSNGTL